MVDTPESLEELEMDITEALVDSLDEKDLASLEESLANTELVEFINSQYTIAREDRRVTEEKWLQAYRDIRGEYNGRQRALITKLQLTQPQASSAFIKISKTKATAAYGQVTDILFADGKVPITVIPTPIPEGAADIAHLIDEDSLEAQMLEDPIGFDGDGRDIAPGATEQSILGGAFHNIKELLRGKKAVKGQAITPDGIEVHPAQESAMKLDKLIQDQLTETDAEFALRRAAWECVHLGTGCVKGPFTIEKTVNKWIQDEETGEVFYSPEIKLFPEISAPSIWNVYPDPRATKKEDAEFIIERHLLNRAELRDFKRRPGFDKEAIDRLLQTEPQYAPEHWETDLRDNDVTDNTNRYEVREYWGFLDEGLANRLGLEYNQDTSIQINAFISNSEVLKVALNPFVPQRIPYNLVPYEELIYQIWGVGLPENMTDSQQLMNAHWRAAIDNLNLAGNVMLEVNENQLVPGQDMRVMPGKIWRKQGGAPGQSIYSIRFADTSQSHMVAFDKARGLADESTGILSFGQGTASLPSGIRTSSQTSMLLQGSAMTIRTVIKNWDHYLLKPLGDGYFQWNMQFNTDLPEIRGDYEIDAKGAGSLLQKEVLSQRLLAFAQVAGSNPVMAPLVDFEYILKELAKTQDLDPEKIINDPVKARLMAELIQMQQGGGQQGGLQGGEAAGQAGGQALGGATGAPGGTGAEVGGAAGGGQIGVGSIPQPGEAGFSG